MMVKATASPILQLIRRVVEDPQVRDLPDRDLLERFHAQQDQAAFHTLLRRHGPMVLDVCRGVLGEGPDAEDAFQATFLILAQQAGSIRKGASLGSWLHGVAHRTALKARARSAVRQKHESRRAGTRRQASDADDLSWREVRQALHEELSGIPERYREPLVMCYLEGAAQQSAATRLGLAERTLRERLERGRELLRLRLVRRGLGPAAVLALAAWPSATVSAAVPAVLMDSTVKAATLVAAGGAATSVVSAKVAALTQGVLRTMFLSKLKVTAAGLLAAVLVGGVLIPGLCALPQSSQARQPAVKQQEKLPEKEPAKKAPDVGKDGAKLVKADELVKDGNFVESLAYCNNGKTVAVVVWKQLPAANPNAQETAVVLWDLQEGKVKQTLEKFDDGNLRFCHLTASKDGMTIAAVAEEIGEVGAVAVKVWDVKTGKLLQTVTSGRSNTYTALSPDGKRVACTGRFGEVFVWEVETGKLRKTLEAEGIAFWSIAFSGDGKQIAAGGGTTGKNKAVVWEVETGKLKHELADETMAGIVGSLAFSPDGKTLATGGGDDATIRVWELGTGKVKHLLNAHGVVGLAFSPDGKTLVSSGYDDSKVIIWDIAKEMPRVTLEGHNKHDKGDFLRAVSFAPDGRTVASGSWDGTMRVWPVPAEQPKK